MAAKEAIVIILDVGKSMCQGSESKLEGAIKATALLVQQKLLHSTKDEIGLVLFGTKKTHNHLATSSEGYEHITVLRDIVIPDLPLLKSIENIKGEGAKGDLFSALIVGMDLLIKKTDKKKWQKRIFLVTDGGCPSNKDDLPVLLDKFNQMDAKLNVIGVDFDEELDQEDSNDEDAEERRKKKKASSVVKSETKIENEKTLREMTSKVQGVVIPVNRALEMMSQLRSKSVLQRTTFRGRLEISEHLSIPVWSYLKTQPRVFPSMKKLSTLAFEGEGDNEGEGGRREGEGEEEGGNPMKGEVRMQRTYHPITDPDTEVPPEERVKGYKYGRTLVPFSDVDAQVLQYKAEKCMKLIGFTLQSNVPRQHFIGNTECIISEPGDDAAEIALSALIRALLETESVAIVRYVKRANSIPHLGVLIPYIHYKSEMKSEWECFYYCKLPFAEDLRQYPFASLDPSRCKKSFVPSPEQLKVTEGLIASLDLMTAAVDEFDEEKPTEALKPKHTFNPALQHFYQCVQKRALKPNTPIPPLDPEIHRYSNPDDQLFERAAESLGEFKKTFPLVPVATEDDQKKKRRFWRDAFDSADVKLDSYIPDPKKHKTGDKLSIDKIFSGGVTEVGSIKPVQDFKDMISRRDVDLVTQACKQMEERIFQLVNDSVGNQLYPKAIECLIALRAGCVKEEESEEWNAFLRQLKISCEGKRRADFWYELVKRMITLIDYDESDDSTVSPEEAKGFLLNDEDETSYEPSDVSKKSGGDDTDDLFDMVE